LQFWLATLTCVTTHLASFPVERIALTDTASQDKRLWITIAIIVAIAIAAPAVVVLLSRDDPPSRTASPAATRSASPTPATLRQAKWHTRTFPAAMKAKMTPKHRKTVKAEGLRASRGIQDVYNALFLAPGRVDQAVRSHFEQRARRAFLRAKVGLPRRFRRAQITYRSVRMGVDAKTAQNAIATVTVLLKGLRGSNRLKIRHEATLWLERVHRSWKVLAFSAKQGPR
jgi:hypothetical protein